MNKKVLLTAIFAVASVGALAAVTPIAATSATANAGSNLQKGHLQKRQQLTTENLAAAQQKVDKWSAHLNPDFEYQAFSNNQPEYDIPTNLSINYQATKDTTYTFAGTTEFEGVIANNQSNSFEDLRNMLNTWGVGTTHKMGNWTLGGSISYINWRSINNGVAKDGTKFNATIVTGVELSPTLTYTSGKLTYNLPLTYQNTGAASRTNGADTGARGYFFQAYPTVTDQLTKNFSYTAGVLFMNANEAYYKQTNAVNNSNSDLIEIKPAILSYNVPEVKGLNLGLETRIYFYNYSGNTYYNNNVAHSDWKKLRLMPNVTFTIPVTKDLSIYTEGMVQAFYTNHSQASYEFDFHVGFNYSFL